MESEDLSHHRRRYSYFSSCMASPASTCLPVHEELEYSRIHYSSSGSSKRSSRRWRNFLRSYSQNFDEGCHRDESGRCPPGFSRRSVGLIT
ncbi:hypothetical protein AB3S75_001787 [Citrus x aurantiifolia]